MSDHVLHLALGFALLNQYIHSSPQIIWHAGEPLTVSQKFYHQAFAIAETLAHQTERKLAIKHSIQTNGTLLTQAWCDLFLRYSVHVGLSLDGPREWHDSRRKTRAGRGTYEKVMRGLNLLVMNRVPFSVITVLGEDSLENAERLFDFFMENSIRSVAFNIEEVTGSNIQSSIQGRHVEQRYVKFLSQFFELADKADLKVRELKSAKRKILRSSHLTNQLVNPLSVLSIDCDGNFSTFCPELLTAKSDTYPAGFTIGNVAVDTIDSALQSPEFLKIHSDISAGVEQCKKNCEYFELCGGGAPSNKLFERGTFDCTETTFCRFTRKAVIDVTLASLEAGR